MALQVIIKKLDARPAPRRRIYRWDRGPDARRRQPSAPRHAGLPAPLWRALAGRSDHRLAGARARPATGLRVAVTRTTCRWCGREFQARGRGGSKQAYCCPRHRVAFHRAARLWAERAIAAGVLTIADLWNGDPSACTLRRRLKPGGDTVLARRVTRRSLKRARGLIELTSNRLGATRPRTRSRDPLPVCV